MTPPASAPTQKRLSWKDILLRVAPVVLIIGVTLAASGAFQTSAKVLFWFLQNQFRARVSHVLHSRKSLDSISALASVPFELWTILVSWGEWHRWARIEKEWPR